MDWSTSEMIGRSMAIDVAWGDTSEFAITITQYRNNKVEVFCAEFWTATNERNNRPYYVTKHRHRYTRLYCDGANPEVIRELKRRIEYQEYLTLLKKRYGLSAIVAGRSFLLTSKRGLERCCNGHIQ